MGNGTTGTLASASTIAIGASGKLTLNRSNDVTLANVISGTGELQQSGSGTVTLTGNNSNFSGSTTLAAGVLNVGHANALGSNSTGTIQFSGGALQYSADNQVDYSARMSSASNGTIKIDTHGQDVTLATGLSGSGVTLTKLGSGNLTLSGANTYTGDSNINAGTLTCLLYTSPSPRD